MRRKKVESSNLASVGYSKRDEELEIRFQDGSIYRYYDVENFVYEALMEAKSKGDYFHNKIKEKYFFKRVKKVA